MNNNEKIHPSSDNSVAEIERIVLSCAMQPRGENVDEIFLQLQADDFSEYKNRSIFIVINSLRIDGKNTDFLSVLTYFENNPEIQFANFKQYITDVYSLYSYQTNILQFIEIIKNNSIENKIKEFGQLLTSTKLDVISSKEKLWNLERDFLNITSNKKSKEISALKSVLKEYQIKLNELRNFKQELTGISSGFPTIDKFTNGFQGGDLIILAARPGIGKTALAINFLVNAAKKLIDDEKEKQNQQEKNELNQKRTPGVLMFSMEMSSSQVCQRILSSLSLVNGGIFKTGGFTNYEWASVLTSIDFANSLPIYIDDTGDLSIMDIQSKIKQMSNDKDIKLVVVDYLQLLKGGSKNNQLNRQQEVTLISRSLKSIARQFNIPIIAIAQLSRKIEERRGDKKPMLSDLRESGSIEQDADLVCFLNYVINETQDNKNQPNNSLYGNNSSNINYDDALVEFIVAKNRNGSTGSTSLMFKKGTSLYLDLFTTINQNEEENKNKMN